MACESHKTAHKMQALTVRVSRLVERVRAPESLRKYNGAPMPVVLISGGVQRGQDGEKISGRVCEEHACLS